MIRLTSCIVAAYTMYCSMNLAAGAPAKARVERVSYLGYHAYRLTNGKTEAIAVPAIGRIMRYGKVGGPNLLWNTTSRSWAKGQWRNYGGEKNWLAPQTSWKQFHGKDFWPPDPAFDNKPYGCRILSGGRLRMTSELSPGTGVRYIRTLSFASNGDLVIEETASKSSGGPIDAAVWSIAQVAPPDWIVMPVNPRSAYKDGYGNVQQALPPDAGKRMGDDLLIIAPTYKDHCKIGFDAEAAAAVSVTGRTALVVSAPKPDAGKTYPEGVSGPGFPVELYIHDDPVQFYCELELLGPMTHAPAGKNWSLTLHWSIRDLPAGDPSSPPVSSVIRSFIYPR